VCTSDSPAARFEPEVEIKPDDVRVIQQLARLVGEDGLNAARRVVRAMARGDTRAYTAELNRLTDKFITSLNRT
jgi:hypothetical protein